MSTEETEPDQARQRPGREPAALDGPAGDQTGVPAGASVGEPAAGAAGTAPQPPRRVALLAVVAAVALALDIVTKVVAVAELEGEPAVELFGGGLYLVLYRNPGAAFSLATGMTWVLTLIAAAVAAWIVWIAPKLRSVGWAVGLGLILGGALGNLVDRLFRAPGPLRGHVVDFLSVLAPDGSVWPVFNLADSAIVTGGATLVLMALLGREYDGTRARDGEKRRRSGEATG
ncbi:signal peptidase II [Longimycelium tulufanense]|uniref:signal peptidase II n=1 Tax=Longimycelium tulufanense TaxID=907463 RepID=UPI0035714D76